MRTEASTGSSATRRVALHREPTLWCPARNEANDGPPIAETSLALRVLASSSSGNCSLLIRGSGATRRLTLIDAGISPRRTSRLLAEMGLRMDQIDDVLFTHLDRDHAYPSWAKALPGHAKFRIHRAHRARAHRMGLLTRKTYIFDDETPIEFAGGVTAHATRASHDSLGVALFRFHARGCDTPVLGYATDIGRATQRVIDHLASVRTLAIESNYCPEMQADSGRPAFLIDRITNGGGHLSNEESAEAVGAIAPTGPTVLLHLSRQCNTPERARAAHAGEPLLAHHERPTDEIPITRST
jgi:phosphoribosyl 1,2-cyclic phosphodiesterase